MQSKRSIKTVFLSLIIAAIFSNCAFVSVKYSVTQLRKNDDNLQNKIINMRMEVLRKDNDLTTGYFHAIRNDTLIIRSTKIDTSNLNRIALDQIKSVKVDKNAHPEILIALATVAFFISVFDWPVVAQ